jgi:hypothetical protein
VPELAALLGGEHVGVSIEEPGSDMHLQLLG